MCAGIARREIPEWIGCDLEEGVGDTRWECDTERVAQPAGILDDRHVLAPGDADRDGTSCVDELGDPRVGDPPGRACLRVEGPDDAQQVGQVFGVTRCRFPAADRTRDLLDRISVEQIAQRSGAQELSEQVGVEGECGGATLGEGGVALVEESRDVPEDE